MEGRAAQQMLGGGGAEAAALHPQTARSMAPASSPAMTEVPAGTYFMMGFVDVDESGETGSTAGDYAGWFGHSGDGNPPATANVVVPATGTATFDFALVER